MKGTHQCPLFGTFLSIGRRGGWWFGGRSMMPRAAAGKTAAQANRGLGEPALMQPVVRLYHTFLPNQAFAPARAT
jgi:hypothetical protein